MKIYTRTGDDGTTGLYAGERVMKDDVRVEAYGTVDELNAALGVAAACNPPQQLADYITHLQHNLFALGAELATPEASRRGTVFAVPSRIAEMEGLIDHCEGELAPLTQFILPGGTPTAAALHLARTICRRAERIVVTWRSERSHEVSHDVIVYLNRVSDFLFVLARLANHLDNQPDVPWKKV